MFSFQNQTDKLLRVNYPLDYTSQYLILSNLYCKERKVSTEAHVPTPWYGQYRTHAHNHMAMPCWCAPRRAKQLSMAAPSWGASAWHSHIMACVRYRPYHGVSPAKNVCACSTKNDTWSISGNVIGSEAKMPVEMKKIMAVFFDSDSVVVFLP